VKIIFGTKWVKMILSISIYLSDSINTSPPRNHCQKCQIFIETYKPTSYNGKQAMPEIDRNSCQ
jgi:hypothetical protein